VKILIFSLVDLKKSSHNSRLHQFLKYLSKNHEITILCINDWWKVQWDGKNDEYNKDFEDLFLRIEIQYITEKKISPVLQEITSVFTLKKKLYAMDLSKYDLLFNYNGLVSGYIISKYAKKSKIPIIYDIADDLPEMIVTSPQIPAIAKPFGKLVGKYIFKKNIGISSKVTLTTHFFQSLYNIPPTIAEIIPNGVDTRLFVKKNGADLRKKLGLDNNFVIGHVGVLREWLDFRPLFDAVKKLSPTYDIKLLIVGGGIGYEETVNLAKTYGITDNVKFTGTIPYHEIPDYIACMDICTIPFKNDSVAQNSLPLKLFEYMACEKPVICSNVRAIRELFAEDVLFVSDSEDYKKAIIKLYRDEPLRNQMGSRGRDIIEKKYQWDVISAKLEKVMIGLKDGS
jgi:glycosyltransferase involved in cell wall biosynthesis